MEQNSEIVWTLFLCGKISNQQKTTILENIEDTVNKKVLDIRSCA